MPGKSSAAIRARVGEEWSKVGKVTIDPARGGTITLTAQPDASVVLVSTINGHGTESDEIETWTLRHDKEYGKVAFKPKKS